MESSQSDKAVSAAQEAAAAIEKARQEQASQVAQAVAEATQKTEEWQKKHEESEAAHRDTIIKRMDTLATKDDIKDIKKFMGDVDLTFTVIRTSGRWGKTIILTLAGIMVAIGIITGGLKALLLALLGVSIK